MKKVVDEAQLIAAGRGKWSLPGVPHLGWQCVDVEDLGAPLATCEMCESQTIRYVHFMEHDAYPDVLEVGCVCAGNMAGDLQGARTREASMKSRSGKRTRWLTRKWKCSAKGNDWIRADGYRVTIYKKKGKWGATVAAEIGEMVKHSRRTFQTQDRAKLAAFDEVTRLLSAEPK